MILKINMQSEVPIYLQLRNEIVKGIGRGEFEPGESLPTVRLVGKVSILQTNNTKIFFFIN